jgi:hypothetical protein
MYLHDETDVCMCGHLRSEHDLFGECQVGDNHCDVFVDSNYNNLTEGEEDGIS